jgi:hypothetical protein
VGGRFSTGEDHFGDDVDLGPEPAEPEVVAKRWREISGEGSGREWTAAA